MVCLLSKFGINDTEGFTGLMINGVFDASNGKSFIRLENLSHGEKEKARANNHGIKLEK